MWLSVGTEAPRWLADIASRSRLLYSYVLVEPDPGASVEDFPTLKH
jgi:hypothetical protein